MEMWYELISQYGYVAIFLLFTLGIIGLPVPGEVLLTFLGFMISIGKMHVILAFVSALGGALCGITISYLLGLKLGEPFLHKFGPKLFIKEKTIKRTNQLFHKYGSFVLFVCYFIPGVRHVAAYLAGITLFSFKRFALFAYSGALVWVSIFLVIGYRLGKNWREIIIYFHKYLWVAPLFIGFIAIAFVILYVKHRRRRSANRTVHSNKFPKNKKR